MQTTQNFLGIVNSLRESQLVNHRVKLPLVSSYQLTRLRESQLVNHHVKVPLVSSYQLTVLLSFATLVFSKLKITFWLIKHIAVASIQWRLKNKLHT